MVGGLTAMASLSSSFLQPPFGMLADRLRRPWFVAFGPMIAACSWPRWAWRRATRWLVALLVLGGVGVAMFHPQTAALAGSTSPHRGLAVSWWVTGGTLGWALGPAYAIAIVHRFGLERTWIAAIPGLVMSVALLVWFRRVAPHAQARRTHAPFASCVRSRAR
jgi:FSR family fosmidomycin resistance protein-like MFS transporter